MTKKKTIISPEQKAEAIASQIEKLCKKYNCRIGVWLTWRDLLHNFDIAKKDPKINELEFRLQVRFENEPTD
jgi:hypothetical protein